jgi:CDP-diacylglycerol--glycerol-3-phosphate 3-phosphatidyltransferase
MAFFISDKNRERYILFITPIGNLFVRFGVSPNVLTIAGLLLSLVAGIIYSTGSFFWGGCTVIFAGTCDVLDGHIARQTGRDSRFGSFLDSTLDRLGEMFIFLGLTWHFSGLYGYVGGAEGNTPDVVSPVTVMFIFLAISGSFMVSYTRIRAEALGLSCMIGWMQRPERITLLIIGSLAGSVPVVGHFIMKLTIILLAVFTNYTVIQRVAHVRKQISGKTELSEK